VGVLLDECGTWLTRLSETPEQRRRRQIEDAAREKEFLRAHQRSMRRLKAELNTAKVRAKRAMAKKETVS
jgi:hypothetical protein